MPTKGKKAGKLDLLDLPAFTRNDLGLTGLNLSTDLLAGADATRLVAIRERADRASCSCLLLIEPEGQSLAGSGAAAATSRLLRVVEAAHILGCTAASVRIEAHDDDNAMTKVAAALKPVVERAEKLDINLVVSPGNGLTERPERVTELLKKIGGFRIGTYPDFEAASKAKDPAAYLHRLTPYATVVSAASLKFVPAGKKAVPDPSPQAVRDGLLVHEPYNLKAMVGAIQAVGYDGPIALDYRGPGDVTLGLLLSKEAMLMALSEELVEEPE
ncbi:MAG: TIM barrel protein [Phycisphaerales bacterium]|jgi:hypothetical protein